MIKNKVCGVNWVTYDTTKIKKCMKTGNNSKEIKKLSERLTPINLKKNVAKSLEEFYQNITKRTLSEAALGWLFVDSFDRSFIRDKPVDVIPKKERYLSQNFSYLSTKKQNKLQFDSLQILNKLTKEKSISKKYNYLKKLISSNNAALVNDSFKEDRHNSLEHAIKKSFNNDNLNIVIIGGGVCGLFLATSLKSYFGKLASVLILDNRSSHASTREPFNREWLTHLQTNLFKTGTPSNLTSLLECFGTEGLIGIPINILETVLQLSCKAQGVKFYFSEIIDYSNLRKDVIDLIFDATGGRLKECSYSTSNSTDITLNIPKKNIELNYTGIKQLHNIPDVKADYLNVVLKPSGDFHYPHIGGTKICTNMVKITSIPINLMQPALEAVKKLNSLNLFYIWNGNLRHEINEGLILVNLLDTEYEFLCSIIDKRITLNSLLSNSPNIANCLNKNFVDIIKMLNSMDVNSQIKIEQPFNYSPYINLNASSGFLGMKRVFPIGDSLFCGHPKMGNGLSRHLLFINDLLKEIIKNNYL